MAKELSIEEAVERARRATEDRVNAIRPLAEVRQKLADTRESADARLAALQREISEEIATAERADVKAFNAALNAGWTVDELRKIGYAEPDKKQRIRKRAARRAAAPSVPDHSTATPPARGDLT